MRRLAIAEATRFPDLINSYWHHAPAKTLELLATAFRAMDAAGELDCPDPEAAALHFAYAVVGPPQDRALLQPHHSMTEVQLIAHSDAAVAAFLRAYRP